MSAVLRCGARFRGRPVRLQGGHFRYVTEMLTRPHGSNAMKRGSSTPTLTRFRHPPWSPVRRREDFCRRRASRIRPSRSTGGSVALAHSVTRRVRHLVTTRASSVRAAEYQVPEVVSSVKYFFKRGIAATATTRYSLHPPNGSQFIVDSPERAVFSAW